MSNVSLSFEEMKNDLLKDDEFKTEYEKLEHKYKHIEQIIKNKTRKNIEQKDIR